MAGRQQRYTQLLNRALQDSGERQVRLSPSQPLSHQVLLLRNLRRHFTAWLWLLCGVRALLMKRSFQCKVKGVSTASRSSPTLETLDCRGA